MSGKILADEVSCFVPERSLFDRVLEVLPYTSRTDHRVTLGCRLSARTGVVDGRHAVNLKAGPNRTRVEERGQRSTRGMTRRSGTPLSDPVSESWGSRLSVNSPVGSPDSVIVAYRTRTFSIDQSSLVFVTIALKAASVEDTGWAL
jgi:hypothetical protein